MRELHWLIQASKSRWLLVWLLILVIPGCRGCTPNDPKMSAKNLKKKDELEIFDITPLPLGNEEVKRSFVKPGHLAEVQQKVKAGREDLQVLIESKTLDRSGSPLPVPGSRWSLNFTRTASLPKGQTKTLDLQYFIGPNVRIEDEAEFVSARAVLSSELFARNSSTLIDTRLTATTSMEGNQYFLTVLANKPAEYQFMTKSDYVSWVDTASMADEIVTNYAVTICNGETGQWGVPSTFLGWTSTAILVWDDVDPATLTEQQQQAILDWLHWGGRIIVSGPSSWSRLSNSFLSPYLPAKESQATAVSQEMVDALNQRWALKEISDRSKILRSDDQQSVVPSGLTSEADGGIELKWLDLRPIEQDNLDRLPPLPTRNIPAMAVELSEEGKWIEGAEKLVCNRRVGRGEIVMTTFPISDPYFNNWRSFQSFTNNVLMGRPSRKWQSSTLGSRVVYDKPYSGRENDSRLATSLRLFTRDSQTADRSSVWFNNDGQANERLGGWDGDPQNGVASWNSQSPVSSSARRILSSAAGIDVPRVEKIATLLAIYLVVLVPVNYLVFYLIGKLEWAWGAVPVIALVGVVVVAAYAQLDIGFARSFTEISVVEMQAGYPRAHVTRYAALYTSLSTGYSINLDKGSGLSIPMLSQADNDAMRVGNIETLKYSLGGEQHDSLYPLQILSNSTRVLHTEQTVPLGGPIQYSLTAGNAEEFEISNGMSMGWEQAVVVRRSDSGEFQTAWLGAIPKGSTVSGKFQADGLNEIIAQWNSNRDTKIAQQVLREERDGEIPVESSSSESEALSQVSPEASSSEEDGNENGEALAAGELLVQLAGFNLLKNGETRLVAWSGETTPGMSVSPTTQSTLSRSALVCFLTHPNNPAPKPDVSLRVREKNAPANSKDLEE